MTTHLMTVTISLCFHHIIRASPRGGTIPPTLHVRIPTEVEEPELDYPIDTPAGDSQLPLSIG